MSEQEEKLIAVEVVFALPDVQHRVALKLPKGSTAQEAVARSGLKQALPEHAIERAPLGVYGHQIDGAMVLADGDRVEIYRPLEVDPKSNRRRRVASGETMSGGQVRKPRR
ncbi:MAG: RnfH family protein [Pseudomonadota bacterium]